MKNLVTVYDFTTEFNNFYINSSKIILEVYNKNSINRNIIDKVYDVLENYKNEIVRTLEYKVLSVEKAGKLLCDEMEKFLQLANNCYEYYEYTYDLKYYETYVFLNSIIDCYNELCEEFGYEEI